MSAILVQSTTWPVVVLTYPAVVREDDIKPFIDELRTLLINCPHSERFACISDLTQVDGRRSEPNSRNILADALRELSLEIRARGGPQLVADARVAPSAFVRGISTAMEWMRPSNWPVRFFTTMEDAAQWVHESLHGPGKPLSDKPSTP